MLAARGCIQLAFVFLVESTRSMTSRLSLAAALGAAVLAANPAASCEQGAFAPSTEEHLQPLSVPASEIGAWLTASPYSSGIHFTSELHGRDLWLDITDFPERAPEVGSIRALMQLGRVVDADLDRLVLVDGQEALFVVAEADLRSVGCQFVWPANTGANPIDLMRRMIEALREENGGRPIEGLTTTGSAGTSVNAVAIVEDHLNVAWVESARPGATAPDIPDQRPDHMVGLEAPRVQASAMPARERLAFNGL